MKKVFELQQERKAKIDAQMALIKKTETEKRDFSDDEQTQFDTLKKEIDDFDKAIEKAQAVADAKKRAAELNGEEIHNPKKEERQEPFSIIRAINAAGGGKMSDSLKAVHEKGVKELQTIGKSAGRTGFVIPSDYMRSISVGGDGGTKGGELVDTTHKIVDGLFPKLTVEQMGASVLTGLQGDLKLISGSEASFSWVAENGAGSETDMTFDGPTLKPKTLRGKVLIGTQWLEQTSPDAEAEVMKIIRRAISNAFMTAIINGDGVLAPKGILNNADVTVKTTATPNWASVVELESAIEADNVDDAGTLNYLMRPELKGKYKTTSKDGGSGIFVIEGKELNGYGYKSSTFVPKLNDGSNDTFPLIFGDWSELYIGQWGGVKLLVDPYTSADNGKVAVRIEMFADVQIANPKAFAINKSLTLS